MTSSPLLAPHKERNYSSRTVRLTIVWRVCDVCVDYLETLIYEDRVRDLQQPYGLRQTFSCYKCNNLIPGLGFFSHGSCEGAEIDYYIFSFVMIVYGFDPNTGIRATCEVLN